MLSVRGVNMRAVRGTVLDDTAMAHLGDDIVIAVPTDLTGNCYYGGLADPAAIAADGSLEGYVVLQGRAASGAFFSWLADEGDRARYNAFSERRIRGQWVQARFRSAAEASR
jgi:hypothetical protein